MIRRVRDAWPLGVAVVDGESMLPTLRPGDVVVVRRRPRRVRVGDLVVVELPGRPLGVKRVVHRVAEGWWVEGDNQSASTDSWDFGAVSTAAVRGRVVWVYRSPRRRAS
jgi:nickel-type superoxide dismutase maturation protease